MSWKVGLIKIDLSFGIALAAPQVPCFFHLKVSH